MLNQRNPQGRFVARYQEATAIDQTLPRPKLEPCREAGCPRRTKAAQGYCHAHRGRIMQAYFADPQPVLDSDVREAGDSTTGIPRREILIALAEIVLAILLSMLLLGKLGD